MSNWWRYQVLQPLYHAAFSIYGDNIGPILAGQAVFPLEPKPVLVENTIVEPENVIEPEEFIESEVVFEPKVTNVVKGKRGRPKGKKDSKPRLRKTKKN